MAGSWSTRGGPHTSACDLRGSRVTEGNKSEQPETVPAAAAAEGAADAAATVVVRPKPTQHFRSMPAPSMPFWIVLIASIGAIAIVIAAKEIVIIFAIAVALSFLLLPIVNWLDDHGWPRTAAA